jgi:hypothetical protein
MFKNMSLGALRRNPRIAYYFRYPLHHGDFHELREEGRLVGRYAAKPLFGKLTTKGNVDRSAGYNGQVAVIFIPARARTARSAQLMLTRMPREKVKLPNGKRNWSAIRAVASKAVRRKVRPGVS